MQFQICIRIHCDFLSCRSRVVHVVHSDSLTISSSLPSKFVLQQMIFRVPLFNIFVSGELSFIIYACDTCLAIFDFVKCSFTIQNQAVKSSLISSSFFAESFKLQRGEDGSGS